MPSLISFLYGGGAFDEFSVEITSGALRLVALGMAGYAVQNILSRVYFARQNGRVPLITGGVSILVNVALCMLLTDSMQVNGLAAASAASATVYGLLLLIPLVKEDKALLSGGFVADLLKMLLATALMFAVVAAVGGGCTAILPGGKLGLLLTLGVSAGAGVAVYFVVSYLFRLEEARMSADLVKRILKRG